MDNNLLWGKHCVIQNILSSAKLRNYARLTTNQKWLGGF